MLYKILKKNTIELLFILMLSFCFFRFKDFAALHLIVFLFSFLIYLLVSLKKNLVMSYTIICWLLGIFILGIISFYFSGNPSKISIAYYLMNYSLPVLYVYVSDSIIRSLSFYSIVKTLKKMLKILNIYLLIELFLRVFVCIKDYLFTRDIFLLYRNMKHMSFAYSDCNFLGLFILWIFCLTLYLCKISNDKFFVIEKKFLIFFGFMSISRSVMLTIIAIEYISYLYRQYKKGYFIFFILNIIMIPICIIVLYVFLLNDPSFRSKVEILQGLKRVYDYSMINVLYGFGFGLGEYAYSYIEGGYGHLHVAMFLGQRGLLGIIYFTFWLIRLNFLSKNNCVFIIFAFLLSGISLSFPDSSFFLCIALIINLEQKYKLIIN